MASVYVDLSTQASMIGISNDNLSWTWLNKKDITVNPQYNGNPNYPHNYRYKTRTQIQLLTADHKVVADIELQDTSRSSWNTGTLTALNQAQSDFASWIST
jgi:hypothetical protein